MEDIRRECNPMVNLSKFTFNKKILSKVVVLRYNQFYNKTLSSMDFYVRESRSWFKTLHIKLSILLHFIKILNFYVLNYFYFFKHNNNYLLCLFFLKIQLKKRKKEKKKTKCKINSDNVNNNHEFLQNFACFNMGEFWAKKTK